MACGDTTINTIAGPTGTVPVAKEEQREREEEDEDEEEKDEDEKEDDEEDEEEVVVEQRRDPCDGCCVADDRQYTGRIRDGRGRYIERN